MSIGSTGEPVGRLHRYLGKIFRGQPSVSLKTDGCPRDFSGFRI